MENYSPLDLLKEAAHYVENQQQNVPNTPGMDRSGIPSSPQRSSPALTVRENGSAEHHKDTTHQSPVVSSGSSIPKCEDNKEMSSKSSPLQDEPACGKRRANMRMYNANDMNSSDETAISQHNHHHHSNGLLAAIYANEKQASSSYRSADSPAKSPSERKRTLSSHSATDSDHKPRGTALPQQLGALPGSVTQVPALNPMMPFVPPFMYHAFDPAFCADALTRQGLSNVNSDTRRQQPPSPGSSPNPASSNGSLQAQGLQRLMYPLPNPALFMQPRAAAAAAPGIGLPDISMGFPSQLAAFTPTTNILPQQLATYAALSDAHKRALEGTTQPLPSQILAPYLKGYSLDQVSAKDRNVSTPTLPAGVGLPAGISTYEFLQKCQEAIKLENAAVSSQPPKAPRRSASPENIKKPALSNHAYSASFHPSYSHASAVSRSKSPAPERKISTPTTWPLKNGSERPHYESRSANCHPPRERDRLHREGNDARLNGEDAGRRLRALAQSSQNAPNDMYGARYKNSHERRSPSPYGTDRWEEYRRTSREYSPHVLSASAEKAVKKRSHELYGIPQDLIQDSKAHSPSSHSSVPGMRLSKSPQRGRSSSPADRLSQAPGATNPFSALAGNAAVGMNEKDAAAYFAHANPYMLHPALGSLTLPFSALPAASYLRQADVSSSAANNAIAEAIVGASPLFRSPVPAEAMSEYARLAGISSYIPLMPQQQQALLAAGMGPSASSAQDYAAALKQAAAFQQSLLLDNRDKERLSSPSHPSHARPFLQNPVSHPSALARGSPNPSHPKPMSKHTPHHLAPSTHPYSSHSRINAGYQDAENRVLKRELSPSPGKRTLNAAPSPVHPLARSSNLQMRHLNDEKNNKLKRRSAEEDMEHFTSKKGAAKRKREVTEDAKTPDVDEHFRRSLGDIYKKSEPNHNKVVTAGHVDDHFEKALGSDTWSKVKSNTKPPSPEPIDPVMNGPESKVRTAASTNALPNQFPHYSLPPWQYPAGLKAQFSSSYDPQTSSRNSAGNRTMKARGTVYPELASDAALTNLPTSSVPRLSLARGDVAKELVDGKADASALPLESIRRSEAGFDPLIASSKSNPAFNPESKKSNPVPPASSSPKGTASPPVSGMSHGLNLTNSHHVNPILTTQPPPYGTPPSATGSYARPPPAYSPRSSTTTSSSSNLPSISPRRVSAEGQANDEAGATSTVSLQS